MKKWWRRIYGQHKLNKACIYIASQIKLHRWFAPHLESSAQMVVDYIDAGRILLDARQRIAEGK
jgi:hypothetical protein